MRSTLPRALLTAAVLAAPAAWPAALENPQPARFDPSVLDWNKDPCTDFYAFACSRWLEANPIPGDENRLGHQLTAEPLEQGAAPQDAGGRLPSGPEARAERAAHRRCLGGLHGRAEDREGGPRTAEAGSGSHRAAQGQAGAGEGDRRAPPGGARRRGDGQQRHRRGPVRVRVHARSRRREHHRPRRGPGRDGPPRPGRLPGRRRPDEGDPREVPPPRRADVHPRRTEAGHREGLGRHRPPDGDRPRPCLDGQRHPPGPQGAEQRPEPRPDRGEHAVLRLEGLPRGGEAPRPRSTTWCPRRGS